MRRVLVLGPMPGQEGDTPPADLSHRQQGRGLTVRGVDPDLLDVFQERVEAGAAEDPDLRGGQDFFPFEPASEEGDFEPPFSEPPFSEPPFSEPLSPE
jgi:hypothetical protein